MNQCTGLTKGIEAHESVDFVVTQAHFFQHRRRSYSDIVLPVTTHVGARRHVHFGQSARPSSSTAR